MKQCTKVKIGFEHILYINILLLLKLYNIILSLLVLIFTFFLLWNIYHTSNLTAILLIRLIIVVIAVLFKGSLKQLFNVDCMVNKEGKYFLYIINKLCTGDHCGFTITWLLITNNVLCFNSQPSEIRNVQSCIPHE